jgi:hypothetical protein
VCACVVVVAVDRAQETMVQQCRVSMWRDPLDGHFRARIAAPTALALGYVLPELRVAIHLLSDD